MVNFLYFALGLVCMKSLILMLNLIMGLGLKVMIFLNGFSLAYGYSHSHTASENLLVSPLEGKLQTTISTVVEWHTRIHSTTVDILTLLLWNEIIVCHTTTVDIPLLLWNEFILCHTTTHCGMTKFSLSLWECYIRTEEKCGIKFPHSSLKAYAQFHHARQNLRCLSG